MVDANVYLVVRKPLLTEKNMHRAEKRREYTFDVDVKANKIEIRRAVESLYNVKVARVHTVTKQGLKRRFGWHQVQTPNQKKAIVKLREGYKIELL
jgi:large subunit ribosomal protein L23